MALKLDMSKAYDRVEWNFLEVTMLKMGFNARWVGLIMSCMNSASYSILVNGVPKGDIRPSRGIRQRDPLSPYLFLICSEVLNCQLQQAARSVAIGGFSLCKKGPKISHLFFVDDTLLFCPATKNDLDFIQSILVLYEEASGQKLNREKTTVFFSKATPDERKLEIIDALGISVVRDYEKYLGLPAMVGRNKKASLNFIKERVWNKLQDWKEKLLSQVGREVLLKAVVQAIPTFMMGCFKLPSRLLNDIEIMIRKFWWGQWGDQHKIHWKNWETLCKPKALGGLGFKDLEKFNEAMLAKQVWRLLVDHSSLFYRVFSAKYFPSRSVFDAKVVSGSYAWQSIVKASKLVQLGLLWRVGNGTKINIYNDMWLPGGASACVVSPKIEEASNWVVANLLELGEEAGMIS